MPSTASTVLTITKQIRDLQKSNDLSLQAAYRSENVHIVRALIIGPPDTPYEFGFYEFNFRFPANYPQEPPKVRAITTNYGLTRFNPNIYANGLVCLSTPGTWRGVGGEGWSPVLGIESVLLSIQSLMSANPFENEPGYEQYGEFHPGAVRYAAKVRHENIRIAVVQRLEVMLGITKESSTYLARSKELRDPSRMVSSYNTGYYASDGDDSSDGDGDENLNAVSNKNVPAELKADATHLTANGTPKVSTPSVSDQAVSTQKAASKPNKKNKSLQSGTNNDGDDGGPTKKQKITAYRPLASTDIYQSDHEFDPFSDVIKLRFLWYFDVYMKSAEEHIKHKHKPEENVQPESKTGETPQSDPKENNSSGDDPEPDTPPEKNWVGGDLYDWEKHKAAKGKAASTKPKPAVYWERMKFPLEVFEYESNMMDGKYSYTELIERLKGVRAALDKETASWVLQGLDAEKSQKLIAREMRSDFDQVKLRNERSAYSSSFDIELVDNNPFVWQLTLFGKFTTNLEGAIITIRICFSPKFPEEQPRVAVLTPLFHHRITKTGGVLCYVPDNSDNISSHVEAIIKAIEDDDPRYDPRTRVNPEAADLRWGDKDKNKIYNRKVRRSVQDSLEAC